MFLLTRRKNLASHLADTPVGGVSQADCLIQRPCDHCLTHTYNHKNSSMCESEFECFNFRMCATATHYCCIKCNSNYFKCIQMWIVLFLDSGQRTFHLETRPSTSHSAIARVSIQLTT